MDPKLSLCPEPGIRNPEPTSHSSAEPLSSGQAVLLARRGNCFFQVKVFELVVWDFWASGLLVSGLRVSLR